MWHQWFNHNVIKLRAYFLSITYVNNVCMQICCLCSDQSVNNVNRVFAYVRCCWHRTAYVVYVCDTLQNGAKGWRGGDKLFNKVIIFVFVGQKKYYRSFITLRLNHWCHMDYFYNLLATFLSLDHVRILAVYGCVRELLECIKNILICVPKMNGGLTGLERREGE